MNGPTPEAEAKISNNPNSNKTAIIGISHQSLRLQRNDINSPATPTLDVILRMKFLIFGFPFYPPLAFAVITAQEFYNAGIHRPIF